MADAPMTTTTIRFEQTLEAAQALKPLILQNYDKRINADRRLPQPIVEALARLGVFRMPAGSWRAMRWREIHRVWGR